MREKYAERQKQKKDTIRERESENYAVRHKYLIMRFREPQRNDNKTFIFQPQVEGKYSERKRRNTTFKYKIVSR